MLVALSVPGFVLTKTKLLKAEATKPFTNFLLYVCQPFLVIQSFINANYSKELLANMGFVLLFGFLFLFGFTLLCMLCFKWMKDDVVRRASIGASVFSNCAFMGIPFLQALFPGNPVPILYCTVFTIMFNLLGWTLLVFVITGEKKHVNIKRAILNPPTLALVVALPLFFINVSVPSQVMKPIDFLANMTSPVSMTVLGIRLAGIKFRELFADARLYAVVAAKLVIVPLISLGILLLFSLFLPIDEMTRTTVYIMMAMPTATTVVLFSERYDIDSAYATKATLITSILSFITVPVLLLLL